MRKAACTSVIQGSFPRGLPAQLAQQSARSRAAYVLPARLSTFGRRSGQSMPAPVRQKMEAHFKADFSDVQVHVGPEALALGAAAFTQGSSIYFAPGQYSPDTQAGQQLLAHELTHVLQQRTGRVSNPFGSGIAVVQDRALEAEAERMGRAILLQHAVPVQARLARPRAQRLSRSIQRAEEQKAHAPVLNANQYMLRIGNKDYPADVYADGEVYFVVQLDSDQKLWVHQRKSTSKKGDKLYEVDGDAAGLIQKYFQSQLVLYRGVSADHVAFQQARHGRCPPKPTANSNVPHFTGESSNTKFIPFSSDKQVAVMAAKGDLLKKNQLHDWSQSVVGVVVQVKVGVQESLCVFDVGEVQVLDPPTGHPIEIKGDYPFTQTRRVDGWPLLTPKYAAYWSYLGHLLNDSKWDSQGVGLFSSKTPDGVQQMRTAFLNKKYWDVFGIALEKSQSSDSNRTPLVRDLYEYLTKVGWDIFNAANGASQFRTHMKELRTWDIHARK